MAPSYQEELDMTAARPPSTHSPPFRTSMTAPANTKSAEKNLEQKKVEQKTG